MRFSLFLCHFLCMVSSQFVSSKELKIQKLLKTVENIGFFKISSTAGQKLAVQGVFKK